MLSSTRGILNFRAKGIKDIGTLKTNENFLTFVFKVTQAIGIKESVNKNRCFDLLVTSVSS